MSMSMTPIVHLASEGNDDLELPYNAFVETLIKKFAIAELELAHNAMGLSGEAGEYTDAIKKHIIYGKPLDRKNVKEELGDVLFFVQDAITKFGFTWQEIFQANAEKLAQRYVGLQYSDEAAIARADKIGEEKEESVESPKKPRFDFSSEGVPYEAHMRFDPSLAPPSEWIGGDDIHIYVYAESQEAAEAGLHIAGPYTSMYNALRTIPAECNLLWRLNKETNKFDPKVGGA